MCVVYVFIHFLFIIYGNQIASFNLSSKLTSTLCISSFEDCKFQSFDIVDLLLVQT